MRSVFSLACRVKETLTAGFQPSPHSSMFPLVTCFTPMLHMTHTRYVLHICTLLHATCDYVVLLATPTRAMSCTSYNRAYDMCYMLCATPTCLAPCTNCPCYTTCTLALCVQLRTAQSSLTVQEGQHEPMTSLSKRRNQHNRFTKPSNSYGRAKETSRSQSPTQCKFSSPSTKRRFFPPAYRRLLSPAQLQGKQKPFPSSTTQQGQSVCALCLSTDPHNT